MSEHNECQYVGRGGEKLERALAHIDPELDGIIAADFGCNIGGFTDCLLQRGAARVYAVDTGYGMLDWNLRNDDRVIAMERTNAMHVDLPEEVDIVVIDAGWTRQRHILPNALQQVKPNGAIFSLFKPQYEAPSSLVRDGIVAAEDMDSVLGSCMEDLREMGISVHEVVRLPVPEKKKNPEAFLHILPSECDLKPEFWPGGPLT